MITIDEIELLYLERNNELDFKIKNPEKFNSLVSVNDLLGAYLVFLVGNKYGGQLKTPEWILNIKKDIVAFINSVVLA